MKIREPTPDYDTTSMASTIIPAENSRSVVTIKPANRRNSADSTAGSSNNGKRRLDGARSTSSGGSTKDVSSTNKQKKYNHLDTNNKTKEKMEYDEKGKLTFPMALDQT